MAPEARVTSIEALEEFRAQLIVFLEKAMVAVDDALDEVTRTRLWLSGEQRMYWEAQLRRRSRDLENVEQDLFNARLGLMREANTNKQIAVRKARLAVAQAQEKLERIKRWNLHYDTEVAPPAAQVEKLRTQLATELRAAVPLLGRLIESLDAYSSRAVPLAPRPAGDAGTGAAPTPEGGAGDGSGKEQGSP